MKMVLHILLKDLRRHWPEAVAFAAVTAGWAWKTAHPDDIEWLNGKNVLQILFFCLWFFLVIRVVHGEVLVGDKEFWSTRPYRWNDLLAAKAIFLVVFLNGPFLAMQIYLLVAGGFHFTAGWVAGLMLLQIAFGAFLTLPAVALAAVTESLAQWVIGVVILGIFAAMSSWIPWYALPATLTGAEKLTTGLGFALVGSALLLVIAWQYSRRRVRPAFYILGAAVVAIPGIVAFSSSPLVRAVAYPRATRRSPLQVFIRPGEDGARVYLLSGLGVQSPTISIPVEASAIASDTVIVIEGSRLEFRGDNGWQWQSPWSKMGITLTSEDTRTNLTAEIPFEKAKQLAQVHPNAKVELAIAVYRLSALRRVETGANRFEIPGVAHCIWSGTPMEGIRPDGPTCTAPLRLPDLVVSRIDSGESTCAAHGQGVPLPAGHVATRFTWDSSPVPADFDLNPVRWFFQREVEWTPFLPDPGSPREPWPANICRGTPVNVRIGSLSGRSRATFELGSLGTQRTVDFQADGEFTSRE